MLTRSATTLCCKGIPGRLKLRMGKLTYIHLFGDWYTVTYAFWLGGFLAFSAPGVFEATHSRFGAFFAAFFHVTLGKSSIELAEYERRFDFLEIGRP